MSNEDIIINIENNTVEIQNTSNTLNFNTETNIVDVDISSNNISFLLNDNIVEVDINGHGSGASNFYELKDCPQEYSGEAGNIVAVNQDEDGLEFISSIGVSKIDGLILDGDGTKYLSDDGTYKEVEGGVTSVNGDVGDVTINVPTALSELSDDSTHRLVTDTEKTTWNNKLSSETDPVYTADKPNIALKSEIPVVPTNVSSFTNDSGYIINISGQDLSTADNTTSGFITSSDLPDISGLKSTVQLNVPFNVDYSTLYSEITYLNNLITNITYWDTSGKTTKLFTKDIVYSGSSPTSVTIKDEVNNKTLNTIFGYSGDDIVNTTKEIS